MRPLRLQGDIPVMLALLGCLLPTAGALAARPPAEPSSTQGLDSRRQLSLDIYRELLEINTTASVGDTHEAARAMGARLLSAGFPEADVHVFQTAPRKGNLVARLRGTGKRKPLLLVAHIDVVEAKRSDWTTDPFKLVEKDGYFYARGSGDDKYMAATWIANLIRYKKEGYRPDRDLIVALETDEESGDPQAFGIGWLIGAHRDLIDAELALNEGGGVAVKNGKPLWNSLQTSEKVFQSYWLETRNPGGHSSQPRPDNAIYELAAGLERLAKFSFPVLLNETTRAYFDRMSQLESGQVAADMKAILAPQPDAEAAERLSMQVPYNALLRTTCVATRLEGGHADNALPQVARAMVNCRILPNQPVEDVRNTLIRVLDDAKITVTPDKPAIPSPPSPLRPDLLKTIGTLTQKFWPGIPVLPTMSTGATDSLYLRNAGIPAYGHSGLASDFFDVRSHGKDERVSVQAFFTGQEYLYELVKQLSGGR
ncbi:MAG TPA: M20/M25/M40 family metallo-hydrolase [Steroidobacteraceae bacterium]|nr:M20/M25/M40 family metallo-hydrolase [Steroidobacteraceae bacterium]